MKQNVWYGHFIFFNNSNHIILAEIYYQKNDCYNSLVMVNSALAFMESEGNENIWIVGRFFQMCIMIVTGQVSAIYPLVDGMESRIYKTENQELIRNYEALRACYTLLNSLIKVIEDNNRQMELCEVYMLLALTFNAQGRKEEAFDNFRKSLSIAADRNFVRLLADEGEAMYQLSKKYRRETATKDVFLNKIINASKEMALMYPLYLKKHKEGLPRLTKKEKEILLLLADERSNIEIAEFLDNTPNTIKHHLKNIFSKLGVNNRTDAVDVAKREQII